ncbi:RRP12-like protein [Seminavis robusta]|uniref:RRP12-like protein n=1 Tax=Seminavis robusta TaxID=568900 RepID=A0A9N8HFQ7_9STRA|nr:RRP12-like protein [Seminavis robusta]|eukprot:Sro536_g162240.1 RRP12-like protein (1296) ;mRNA; f:55656-59699
MMDVESYSVVLQGLKSPENKRDPRKLRLAAVAAAMSEVVGAGSQNQVSAAKVYAATVSALEGTLKENASTPEAIMDSISTQVALLEVLRVTVPHVSNPAILDASLPLSSRLLLAMVQSVNGMEDNSNNLLLSTKDDLGAITGILKGVCKATTEIIKHVTRKCDAKLLKQLYFGTLIPAAIDTNQSRSKLRAVAQTGILEILVIPQQQCHPTIKKSTTTLFHNRLRQVQASVKQGAADPPPELLPLVTFLEKCILFLDVATLGTDLMELLVACLNQAAGASSSSISDFVAMNNHNKALSAPRLVAINGLLSVVMALVGANDNEHLQQNTATAKTLYPRVLATLLQSKPTVVFHESAADMELIRQGRTLYSDVLLASLKGVIETDAEMACKLFPVVVQLLVQLGRTTSDDDVDEVAANAILTELGALFRSHFSKCILLSPSCSRQSIDKCVEGSLAALKTVVQPAFKPVWATALRTLVILLSMVEEHEQVPEIVRTILKLRQQVADGDLASCRAIDESVGSLVQSVGIETFWGWVDWTGRSGSTVNQAYTWLVPVMKTASSAAQEKRPRLEFFRTHVLDLARRCATLGASSNSTSSRSNYDAWVVSLWSLFSCFCHHPSDLSDYLETLLPTLVKAMEDERYPQLLGLICFGLETLSKDARERMKMDDGTLSEENQLEAEVLSKASVALLPVLFKNVERLHSSSDSQPADDMEEDTTVPRTVDVDANLVQRITEAIASLASLAPKPFLQKLFKKVLSRLLAETQADDVEKMKVYSLLCLSQALVASGALQESSVSLLYRTLKPMIRDDKLDSKVQKMAYRVLLEICQCYHSYVAEKETMADLIDLLTGTAVSANIPARSIRLKCIGALVDGFGPGGLSEKSLVGKITGEVLLCLKDSKGKTRTAAHQALLSLAKALGDAVEFLQVVTSALASETSHMRSAAVDACSRLVFEYAREDVKLQQSLPSLLQTVLILFDEQSREVIKSSVGFVRVCVVAMEPDQLQPMLPAVVGSLLKYHKGKDRFRKKIKIILKKLVRLYGYDTLMPLVPESDNRLLVHMRKLDERAKRRKAEGRSEAAVETGDFDDLVDEDEVDSDDGRTLFTGATGLTRKTRKTQLSRKTVQSTKTSNSRAQSKASNRSSTRLSSEQDGEIVNILGLKEKELAGNHNSDEDSDDDDDDMEFDDTGRLVVFDDDERESNLDNDGLTEGSIIAKRRRLGSNADGKSASARSTKQKRGKTVQQLGASYKSSKAGGDVMKKGQKYEPYAYVPLDGRSYSKKNRRRAVEQMATVVPHGGKRKRK